MSKEAKRALKSVADYLFLSKNAHGSIYSKNRHKGYFHLCNIIPNEYIYRMSFYFNSLYSPFWFIGTLMTLIMEFQYLDPVYKASDCILDMLEI
ncbi:unnamed protein product [Schistosoma rodhaini]|nr:unnamed protein product [Schistosoma rodhaini]